MAWHIPAYDGKVPNLALDSSSVVLRRADGDNDIPGLEYRHQGLNAFMICILVIGTMRRLRIHFAVVYLFEAVSTIWEPSTVSPGQCCLPLTNPKSRDGDILEYTRLEAGLDTRFLVNYFHAS